MSAAQVQTNPRYEAFIKTGGGPSWEYMAFISRAKRFAQDRQMGVVADRVVNHDVFTIAVQWYGATLAN